MLPHPSGRGRIDVTAPLPPHMRATWEYFGFDARQDGDPFAEIAS
jgi:23S rRNA pseudouridine955/2504/2580 synthase